MLSKNTISLIDNRTSKTLEIPIENGAINSTAFKELGLKCYDPGYFNTAVCRSAICKIDGNRGRLYYRGYSIEELVEKSNYLEVTYLLIYGELPNMEQYQKWKTKVMHHTFIHEDLINQMKCSRYNAHPQSILAEALTRMGSLYPEANPAIVGIDIYIKDLALREKQIFRLLGKVPTLAAYAYRHRIGRPYNMPLNDLGYCENFLYMLDRLSENEYHPHPVLVRALEKLWIIHAEHGLNCSTATMRQLCSTRVEVFAAVSGATLTLYGTLHGGANEAALKMLKEIGTPENVSAFLDKVKRRERKLMGFGHRVYKSYDPRAALVKKIANDVFDLLGRSSLMDVALEVERQALNDEYFISRQLAPNVDFYTGLIYNAMGFPTDMFPVLFTIPRISGWLAHWVESLESPPEEQKIFRPQQIYIGEPNKAYVDIEKRGGNMSSMDNLHYGGLKYQIPKTAGRAS